MRARERASSRSAAAALASGGDAVVSDVGSTKCSVLEGLAERGLSDEDRSRFVGGHPLAGAEAAGVEHASADLFQDARWYLTPTESTSGVHYDRLYRTCLGARRAARQRSAPTIHDRLMATVSHLPTCSRTCSSARRRASWSRNRSAARDRAELPRRDPRGRGQSAAVARHLARQPRCDRRRARDSDRRAARRCSEDLRARRRGRARALDRAARARIAAGCSRPTSPAGRSARCGSRSRTGPGSSPSSRSPSERRESTSSTWRSTRRRT